jgi:glycosyltransferase involved in cell wall biosynthesis
MSGDWQHALEIHPAGWSFPVGKSWIAGWLVSRTGRAPADVRAWVDHRPFLGLCALPRPDVQQAVAGNAHAPAAGFSFLLAPHRGARHLRIEVCDLGGEWEEVAHIQISVAGEAPPPPSEPAPDYSALLRQLLQAHRRRPGARLAALAFEVVAAHRSQPLDTEPNPPFWGKLEEPTAHGRLKYGRLTVTGWLAHREHAITALTAVLDPQSPVPLLHGQPRRDVSGVFAELRGSEHSQFLGNVDLPAGMPLPAALRIFATLDNGQCELVFTRRFRPSIVAGAEPALPNFSGTLFARCALALHRAARRQSLPTTGFISSARAAFSAYRDDAPRAPSTTHRPQPTVDSPPSTGPLRVLLATHNLNLEGAPLFFLEYARFLAAQPGFSVHLISPAAGPLQERFAAAGVNVEIVDLQAALTAGTAADFHSTIGSLAPVFAAARYDLVVANTMVAFWGVHLARKLGLPSLLYIHESAPVRRFFAPLLAPSLIPEVETAFGLASRVAFIAAASQAVHARLERHGNFRFMPSWIDVAAIERYTAANPRGALRSRLGIPAAALVFANIGSVCERKGQHIYIRAIELLQRELAGSGVAPPPRHYLMVGGREGLYLDSLRHDIALRNLGNVTIVPEVDDPFAYYGAADVFVCSSFEEAFPRVLLEAAVFGLPIASTDVNGVPEMLGPCDAWLCPPGDPARLAAAMRGAMEAACSGDRSRILRAKTGVVTRFDARTNLPQHLALTREAGPQRP